MRFLIILCCAASLLFAGNLVHAAQPHWIWSSGNRMEMTVRIDHAIESARLVGVVDHGQVELRINDTRMGLLNAYDQVASFDITSELRPGINRLKLATRAVAGPSALAAKIEIRFEDGSAKTIVTDGSWSDAQSFGEVDQRFWNLQGEREAVDVFENYEQWRQAKGKEASTATSAFQLQSGFEIDLIRSAAKDEDSWISMEFDPQGRIIIAREKSGLIRLTLGGKGVKNIEVINKDLPEIRGVLFAHGCLYVNSNTHNVRKTPRDRTGGLYRLRDTNGDDQFDEVKLLGERTATGGHGRNDITLGPDGKIYLIGGDSVATPKEFNDLTPSIPNTLPGDDLPHGHVIRTDKDGEEWELVCKGLRNPYGIHFNPDGEMFTFDADAEHDMGAPWYRPTRLRQLVEGADYGWRRVTGRWPPYYPDHADEPPLTLDIGKSSPTAVKFGSRSKFPQQWREALYILDWTYGRILAVHMTPRGAGYQCRTERFLQGKPANVTDLDFGPDGAMYFVTGGRGTQSGLYRVRHTGKPVADSQPTEQMKRRNLFATASRKLRNRILHSPGLANNNLGNPDPWIRYAARTSVEKTSTINVARLKSIGSDPTADLTYLTALARRAATPILITMPDRLNQLDWKRLNEAQKLDLIRALELCLLRIGDVPAMGLDAARTKLAAAYPDESRAVNFSLCALLSQIDALGFVTNTLHLLSATEDQRDIFHYLFQLRNQKHGWTDSLRQRYVIAFRRTKEFRGGAGLPKFLKQIKADFIAAQPAKDRKKYQALLDQPDQLDQLLATIPNDRKFVREWQLRDFEDELKTHQPDLKRGERMYTAASCILCHQIGTAGRVFGPDLTSVSARFNRRNLLESILDPSKVISEKYRNVTLTTNAGDEHTGRVLLAGDYRRTKVALSTNPLDPKAIVQIDKSTIEKRQFSTVSSMPEGLLNSLTKTEILDLLAYIETGGK